jgi:tetratricopeptide (TPR) repeat protein
MKKNRILFFALAIAIVLFSCASNQAAKKETPSLSILIEGAEKSDESNFESMELAGESSEQDASWGLGSDSIETKIGKEQVSEYVSIPMGLKWNVKDTLWRNWESIAEINPDADLMLVNVNEELGFFIYSAMIDMNFLNAEDVFNAMLMRHGIAYNTENISIKKNNSGGDVIWNFDIVFVANGFDFNYKGKFFFGSGRAVMAISWAQGILYNKYKNEMERAVNGLKLEKSYDKNAKQKFSARIVNLIGLLRLVEDKPIEALSYFERANSMDTRDTIYLINCGFVYQLRHLYGPGISHFESQMNLVKQSGKLLHTLSALHKSLSNFKKTKEYAELALEKMPLDEEANINLSDALWGLGQRAASLEIAQTLYEKQPTERLGIYYARTLMGLNRYSEAADLLLDAKKQFDISSRLALNCVEALLFLNRYEEALFVSEEALAKDKKNADLFLAKGKSLFYLRNYKGAEQALNQTLAINSESEDAKSYLSASKAFLGKADMKAIQKAIEPAEAKPANIKGLVLNSLSMEKNYPIAAHYLQETVKVTPNQPWVSTEQRLLQVLNAGGVQLLSEIATDFLPGVDRVYINTLDVYDSSFKLKYSWNPKNGYITYATASAHANEKQTVHIPLQLEAGDFIYYMASRTAIKADGSIPYTHHKFSREYPIGKSVFKVYADTAKILFDEYGDAERTEFSNGIKWELNNPVIIHKEPYMPTYKDFGGGVVLAAKIYWNEEGDRYQNLIQHQYKNSIPVREQAFETAGTKKKLDAIYAISDWVRRNIKYTHRGFGGHSLIPKTALATLQEKQGDCKDQSLLLQEMLAVIGVKSHLALINLDEIGSEAISSIQQFNHEILYVPATKDNPELWIDPSDKVSNRRPVPLNLEGRVALVIKGDSSYSTITPVLEINQEHEAFLFHRLRMDENGIGHFRDSLVFTGKFASAIRNELLQRDLKEQNDYFAKWISQNLESAELVFFKSQNAEDFSKPLEILIVYNSPQFSPYPALWERSLMRLPAVKERRHPIRIPHETKFNYSLSVSSAKGQVSLNAENEPLKNLFVEMKVLNNGKCSSNTCNLNLEWRTDAVFADPNEYENVKQEWDAALRIASPKIMIRY